MTALVGGVTILVLLQDSYKDTLRLYPDGSGQVHLVLGPPVDKEEIGVRKNATWLLEGWEDCRGIEAFTSPVWQKVEGGWYLSVIGYFSDISQVSYERGRGRVGGKGSGKAAEPSLSFSLLRKDGQFVLECKDTLFAEVYPAELLEKVKKDPEAAWPELRAKIRKLTVRRTVIGPGPIREAFGYKKLDSNIAALTWNEKTIPDSSTAIDRWPVGVRRVVFGPADISDKEFKEFKEWSDRVKKNWPPVLEWISRAAKEAK